MLRVFVDSDMDFTPEKAAEYGFGLISMPYSIDGNVIFPYVDYEVFDQKAFYDKLRDGVIPTTSAISAEKYIEYFEPVFESGNDILYIHFSAAMSATFTALDEAIRRLRIKYPDRRFYKADTLAITTLSYNIACEAGDLYKKGATAEQLVSFVEKERQHFAMYFFADDLKFFRHSGRVSGLAATMGTMLGIRPIIYIGEEGKMISIGKERGRVNAMEKLVSYVRDLGKNIREHRIVIGHSDCEELALEFKQMLLDNIDSGLNIELMVVNPTAGSHCGPNGVGISFYAKHR
ncbi:MAG: DegV family protein [Lachnospiraceae bacterium]|nr:DegV family protein [Lachnospiraceae bacterium]